MKKLLAEIKKTVQRGSFVLKGGSRSDYYLDIRSLIGNPKTLALAGKELAKNIPNGITCLAASGYGGISLATIVSHYAKLPLVLVRTEKKNHGLANPIIGYQPTKKDSVLIIDDIYTSGTSIRETSALLKKEKVSTISALVIVNRGIIKKDLPVAALFSIKEILGD